ncbi:MAG: phosphatase PAP2 family protein [Desulfomonile sp.]|nr:phosphatase PAP2 family protein [Desulfomonile sp.]
MSEPNHVTLPPNVRCAVSPRLAALVFFILVALFIPAKVYDQAIFEALNSLHTPITDRLWFTLTSLGDGLVLGIILGAFLVKDPRVTALGLLLLVLSTVILHLIKVLYPALRPAAVLDEVHVVGPLLRSGSFPSGHASSATAAGLAIIAYSASSTTRWTVGTLLVLMSASRIFVGAHWPSDVIAGMALSTGLFAVIQVYPWPRWKPAVPEKPRFDSRPFRWLLVLEAAAALFTLFVYSTLYSSTTCITAAAAICVLAALLYGWLRRLPIP